MSLDRDDGDGHVRSFGWRVYLGLGLLAAGKALCDLFLFVASEMPAQTQALLRNQQTMMAHEEEFQRTVSTWVTITGQLQESVAAVQSEQARQQKQAEQLRNEVDTIGKVFRRLRSQRLVPGQP